MRKFLQVLCHSQRHLPCLLSQVWHAVPLPADLRSTAHHHHADPPQDRAAAAADQRRMDAARAAQHRMQEQRLLQQPDAEVGRALQEQAQQRGGAPPRLTGQ